MLLLLAVLCFVYISSTSSRAVHDSEATERHASEFPEIFTAEASAEGVELPNFVSSLNQSDSSDISMLEEKDIHSEDSSAHLVSEEKHLRISKRSVTVSDAPNLCEKVPIDTFLMTKDGSTYVFKGDFYWKIKGNNGLHSEYPRMISKDWDGLPGCIDASFTRANGPTYFFKGKWYWKFVDKYMDPDYPKLISVGFPGIPDYVDAAVALHSDGKEYFFKGEQYWQYKGKGYPKNIKDDWNGLPSYLDAAFRWDNDRSYFFKDGLYYRINEKDRSVESNYPLDIGKEWFDC